MNLFQHKILPLAGMFILILFLGLSYINDYLFMEKLVVCSIVLAVIFFIRINEMYSGKETENNEYEKIQNSSK